MTEKYFEIPRALLSSEQHKSEDKMAGNSKFILLFLYPIFLYTLGL